MSPANLASPVTLARASSAGSFSRDRVGGDGLDRRFLLEADLDLLAPDEVAVGNFLRWVLWDVDGPFPGREVRLGRPSLAEAMRMRAPRASAAAWRRAGPKYLMLREPNVPASYGQRAVSPMIISTEARGTSSSSASIIWSAVRVPWPSRPCRRNRSRGRPRRP